jgi:hypothetical protein
MTPFQMTAVAKTIAHRLIALRARNARAAEASSGILMRFSHWLRDIGESSPTDRKICFILFPAGSRSGAMLGFRSDAG